MSTVAEILADKGTSVLVVLPGASAHDAIEQMATEDVGALVVLDGTDLLGIVTERGYLRSVAALGGRTAMEIRVAEIMSPVLSWVSPTTTVAECMRLMTERRVRHLPVLVAGRLSGLVSIGDVVKCLLDEQTVHIRDLTDYIQGRA